MRTIYYAAIAAMGCALVGAPANAQETTEAESVAQTERVRVSIRAGVGGMALLGYCDDEDAYDEYFDHHDPYDEEGLPSFMGGVSVSIPIANHWGIQTGAFYQEFGSKSKFRIFERERFSDFVWESRTMWKTKLRTRNIMVPVMVQYGRPIGSTRMRWDAAAGPYVSFAFQGDMSVHCSEYDEIFPDNGVQNGFSKDYTVTHKSYDPLKKREIKEAMNEMGLEVSDVDLNKVGVGFNVDGGVTFWDHLYVGLRFNMGLSPYISIEDNNWLWGDDCHIGNMSLTFNVGYTF